ncbi:MAG: hypothetical protein HWE12_03615 [Oceanospirillaceae bacterium]|nr:hypothetical protein [Oceanospirillaceae bacterium]
MSRRSHILKLPYTTKIHGNWYYRRRFPKRLSDAGLLPDTLKRKLLSNPDDYNALIAEINRCNQEWQSMISLHDSKDPIHERKVMLLRNAHEYLRLKGLRAGQGIATFSYDELYSLFPEWSKVFTQAATEQIPEADLLQGNTPAEIQKLASELLVQEGAEPLHMLSDVWLLYMERNQGIKSQRDLTKETGFWNKFLEYGGGDCPMSEESINQYLKDFNRRRTQEIKAASISRQLNTIISAIRTYMEKHDLEYEVKRPKLLRDADTTVNAKSPLTYNEQHELIKLIPEIDDWQELYILLALHSGMHPSEAVKLDLDSFDFSRQPYVFILNNTSKGKTEERTRTIPLVYRSERIRQLVESTDSVSKLRSMEASNVGLQIKKILVRIHPEASAYTLRHTLGHNADSVYLSETAKANLGGWSGGKGSKLSTHMFKYGRGGKDAEERIIALANEVVKMLKHLPK